MKLGKKVTDFIRLEEGSIGRKSAMVTGALLASGVLGMMLTTEAAEASTCPPDRTHQDIHYHNCNVVP
jgi:hypothetical protein